jgi:hypothetical protein
MEVYVFYRHLSQDGRLTLPDELNRKVGQESRVRMRLFVKEEEAQWKKTAAVKFFQGYADEDRIYDDL